MTWKEFVTEVEKEFIPRGIDPDDIEIAYIDFTRVIYKIEIGKVADKLELSIW